MAKKTKDATDIYGIIQYRKHGGISVCMDPVFSCVTEQGMQWVAERIEIPPDLIEAFQQKNFMHEYGEMGWRFVTTTVDHQWWYTVPESLIEVAEMELADTKGRERTAVLIECCVIGQRQVAEYSRKMT